MSLAFDFTADKAAKTVYITREFAAGLDLVWDAFTIPEIIVQWTAPKPFRAYIKEMDFREGGRCLTAMITPENSYHWSLQEFTRIQPKTSFSSKNTFCDENGNNITNGFSLTKTSFEEGVETTTVRIEKQFDDLAVLEMMVAKGYKEGMTMALNNLDEYFLGLVTSR